MSKVAKYGFIILILAYLPFEEEVKNLVLGRTHYHHIYDLIEVGVENFSSMESFGYGKKLAPQVGSKPFFAFLGPRF